MKITRAARALLLAVAAAPLLVGCSIGSTGSVSQSDVEDQVSAELAEQVGSAPDDVSCPGDLDAEVDTTMECTLTDGADEIGVTVTVTSVDGSDVGFDIQVDDEVKQ